MAAPARVERRVEIGLESLELTLGDLPEVAREWGELSGSEQASWSLDWDNLMATYLPLLDRHYRSGRMTAGQATRYRELLKKLKDALATIQYLDLYRPPVSLDG